MVIGVGLLGGLILWIGLWFFAPTVFAYAFAATIATIVTAYVIFDQYKERSK